MKALTERIEYENAHKINDRINKDMFKMCKEDTRIDDGIYSGDMIDLTMFLNYLRTIETNIATWKESVTEIYGDTIV